MKNKRITGSYYTPKLVAAFMVEYVLNKIKMPSDLTILEPSAGDGIFIRTILDQKRIMPFIKRIVAVENNKAELNKIKTPLPCYCSINKDFLIYQKDTLHRFKIIIGNPPYIKRNHLSKRQIKLCEIIHQNAHLEKKRPYNIWSSFLVRCISLLESDGILAFILPAEFLQVKFAKELRELVLNEFDRVEIFTFNELLFKECKGQDTMILIGMKRSDNKGVFYSNISKIQDLYSYSFNLSQNIKIQSSKWTHHHISPDEIDLIFKLKEQVKTVSNYCSSKAGIVTAANDYFIVNSAIINAYSLIKYARPIIQKGMLVNGSVLFTRDDFDSLVDNLKPAFLLDLKSSSKILRNTHVKSYLALGIERAIDKRYKSSIRTNWYEVPNIGAPSAAFFFKRCNEYPKFIRNDAEVLVTDSAYAITMFKDFKVDDLIFSFYNSFTLAFSELNGRYYGGGVLELTPNEFKEIPVPYVSISNKNFKNYVKEFNSKKSIKDICRKYDNVILKSIDKALTNDDVEKIFNIREKLYLHRIKTN